MARTSKQKTVETVVSRAGRQAPAGAWSPDTLMSAIQRGTDADRVEALTKAGIIDASGNLTKTYKNWGTKVTRTPDAGKSHKTRRP